MGLLDVILEMQSQGLGEEEIAENLRQQGFSPKEISDAFSQLQVREAVSQEYSDVEAPQPGEEAPAYQGYGYNYPQSSSSASSEMVAEIVEQVVAEKIAGLNKSISSLTSLKSDFEERLKDFDSRIKKLEESIDTLQKAILGKIGDYGKDIKSIHQEMGMMQESFSKALNPLMEQGRKMEKSADKRKEKDVGGEETKEEESSGEKSSSEEPKEEEESGLEREHFNFDLLKKIGRGKS